MHVVSDDKLWKCHNMAFLVATGFLVLCCDSGFCVTIGLGLGVGFLGRDRTSLRLKSSMSRHTVLCCDRGWSL